MDGASDKITVGGLDHANDNTNDDNLLTSGSREEVDSQNNNGTSLTNEEMAMDNNDATEHPIDTNNNVDFEEEEEPETQESFTQHEMTQTGNELTQMGLFDDDDDDGNNCNDDEDGENSQQEPMIDPLTLPWGRLMPMDQWWRWQWG